MGHCVIHTFKRTKSEILVDLSLNAGFDLFIHLT